jgi:hypothetical protein
MADNLGYTPGSGATVATDEVGGIHYQIVKPAFGADGQAQLVSEAAPMPVAVYGELVEAIEAMRMAVQSLARSIGQVTPDIAGRMRTNIETGTLTSVGTVTTVTGVTTVAALTNQTQIGGLAATEQIPALMRLGADSSRRNITVT